MNKFLKNSRNLEINVAGRVGKSNGKIFIKIGEIKYTLNKYNFTKAICKVLKPLIAFKNLLLEKNQDLQFRLIAKIYYQKIEDKEILNLKDLTFK